MADGAHFCLFCRGRGSEEARDVAPVQDCPKSEELDWNIQLWAFISFPSSPAGSPSQERGAWVAVHPFLSPDDLGANHVVDVDTSSQEDGWQISIPSKGI